MLDRLTLFRPPTWAQDLVLALFITVMQVQGTVVRNAGEPESVLRPLSDLGYLGYGLLVVGGAVVAVRRRWPVAVFATTALASLVYYAAAVAAACRFRLSPQLTAAALITPRTTASTRSAADSGSG